MASACGGDDDITIITPVPADASPSATTVTASPTPDPTEFRMVLLNLLSPVSLDATDTSASDTFDERLRFVIDQLKEFKPDLIALNEVTKTAAHGSVKDKLAVELKMEAVYVPAKPWIPGQTRDQNAEFAQKYGLAEEGELILIRSDRFPVLGYEQKWLNPRDSELGGPAALHVRLKGPESLGEIDIFLSQLSGGDSRIRSLQAADFAKFIKAEKGSGPSIVLGDFGDPAGSATQKAFVDIGMSDVLEQSGLNTCCRPSVLGPQPDLVARTDYILTSQWAPTALSVFVAEPKKREDGTLLYASDHNGLAAIFPIAPKNNP